MKRMYGNLIDLSIKGEFDVMIHGCNCFNTMGKGIAFGVRRFLPEAYQADQKTLKGSAAKLGTYSSAQVKRGEHEFVVVNAYTQFDYWTPGRRVDYVALREIFRQIKKDFSGKRIGYPRIGCNLGGGDWDVVSKIIDEELEGEDHTLVALVHRWKDVRDSHNSPEALKKINQKINSIVKK